MSNIGNNPPQKASPGEFTRRLRGWQYLVPLGMASGLPQLLRAENQLDYRFEDYTEDGNRMTIKTDSIYFEQSLADSVIVKGELTYDGISGATPTGTHQWIPVGGGWKQGAINLTHMQDIRRAENLELDWGVGNNTFTPGFAYSKESDYQSYGVSFNHAINFNEKNTIVGWGISHNFDMVRNTLHDTGNFTWSHKQSTEGLISLAQILSPRDILNATVTYGNDSGFLSDPYRQAEFIPTGFGFGIGVPERRPAHRNKEILFASETHHFDPLNGSIEGSYRFYHDSYGVYANTVGITWHQWVGKVFILEPFIRGSEQSAASFYATQFTGPFTANPNGPPGYHSSDYRLSEMATLDVGIEATMPIGDNVRIVAGYHRYSMFGLDGKTSDAMYPKANVFTVGLSILW